MASLYNIRSVVICLLAFAAFLRFDELSKLVRSDVKIENDMLRLFIQSSKTDQYRDGAWIDVASFRKATCPVSLMNRHLDRAGLSSDSPLFCQLSKTNCGHKPRSKGLSYSRLRELVLEAFKDIVPDISSIGTHSLWSGGATAGANAGVPDRSSRSGLAGGPVFLWIRYGVFTYKFSIFFNLVQKNSLIV